MVNVMGRASPVPLAPVTKPPPIEAPLSPSATFALSRFHWKVVPAGTKAPVAEIVTVSPWKAAISPGSAVMLIGARMMLWPVMNTSAESVRMLPQVLLTRQV